MPNKLDTALKASSSLFKLLNGMYIVRMAPQKTGQKHNPVTLSQAPSEGGAVDFFPAEKVIRNTLANPGDCIVLRVKGEGVTLIATEFHEGKPTNIQLHIERIDAPSRTSAIVKPTVPGATKAVSASKPTLVKQPQATLEAAQISINLMGHIQNQGDVVVKNDWLGKPGSKNRLEGFAIKASGLPAGVQLIYGCKFHSEAFKPQTSKEGKYIGTRRKAQPIKSVIFGLQGEGAEHYQLGGQVAFNTGVGANIVANHEIKGPQGTEHLVAINLAIAPKARVTAKVAEAPKVSQNTQAIQPEEDDGLWDADDIAELFNS